MLLIAYDDLPHQERLANKAGRNAGTRPTPTPTDLQEATHAPTINPHAERRAVQAQARQWADGHVHIAVEDRLIAQAAKPKEEAPLPEMKPVINPMSEKILARRGPIATLEPCMQALTTAPSPHRPERSDCSTRGAAVPRRHCCPACKCSPRRPLPTGPIAPLEERLQVPVKHIRGGVGSELDDVTLAPKLSEGTSKLLWILRPIAPDCPPHHLIAPLITGKLVQKQERKGSIAERLLSWGEQHKRGEGDASLADRKYKFGGDEPPAPAPVPMPPRPKREMREARGGVSVNKTAGMVAAEKVAAERAKLEQAAVAAAEKAQAEKEAVEREEAERAEAERAAEARREAEAASAGAGESRLATGTGPLAVGNAARPPRNPAAPRHTLFTVTDIYPEHVVLDGNHPLAGIAIRLHMQIEDVRAATSDELAQRSTGSHFFRIEPPHVQGDGGSLLH